VSFPYSFLFPTFSYFFKILTCTIVRTESKRATTKFAGFLLAVRAGGGEKSDCRGRGGFCNLTPNDESAQTVCHLHVMTQVARQDECGPNLKR
jgi:hypothetical protein